MRAARGPAAAAGKGLEMLVAGPRRRCTESEPLRTGPAICCNKLPGDSDEPQPTESDHSWLEVPSPLACKQGQVQTEGGCLHSPLGLWSFLDLTKHHVLHHVPYGGISLSP